MPPTRATSPLVVAFTPRSLIISELSEGGRTRRITASPTPDGSVMENNIVDPIRLGHALRTACRQMGLRNRVISVVAQPDWYGMRALRLPDLNPSERRPVVRGELEQGGALPFGRGSFDYIWMSPDRAHSDELADAYAYFMGEQAITAIHETIDAAGLRLGRIEAASLATFRAYALHSNTSESLAVLHCESRQSDLAIYQGRTLRQIRRIAVGHSDLLGPDRQERRGQPTHFGGPDEPSSPLQPPPVTIPSVWSSEGEAVTQASTLYTPEAPVEPQPRAPAFGLAPREKSILAQEVVRTLAYFARQSPDLPQPAGLILVGPGRLVRALQGILQDEIDLPVTAVNLLAELQPSGIEPERLFDEEICGALASLGSAVSSAVGELGIPSLDIGIQDTPVRIRSSRAARRWLLTGLGAGATCLALSIGAIAMLNLRTQEVFADLKQTQGEVNLARAVREPILRRKRIRDASLVIHRVSQIPAGAVLGRIAAAANPGVRVRSITLAPMGGLSVLGESVNIRSVERFALDLGKSEVLQAPQIQTIARENSTIFQYNISAKVGPERTPPPATPAGPL